MPATGPGARTGDDRYELIAGERRWRAAKRARSQTIPAVVKVSSDDASLEQALVENLHRDDLNPLEEAATYQQLIEDFGLTHDDLSRRVTKSRSAITNTLRLHQLPPSIQRLVADGQLSAGHAGRCSAPPTAPSRRRWPGGREGTSSRCERSRRRSGSDR